MSGRTPSTRPVAAAAELRGRRIRNLSLAILLPLLLAIAYLAGHAGSGQQQGAIPGLIVNQDELVESTGVDGESTTVVAGRLLVQELTSPEGGRGFDWQLADAEGAEAALDRGEVYVVVTIPADFSASVVSLGTAAPEPATLQVTTDQSHDYLSGLTAAAVADAVTAQFGTEITEQVVVGLVAGLDETGVALGEAADGASRLADGAGELGSGFREYTNGQQQLSDGLTSAATGTDELADGARTLDGGLSEYAAGVTEYTSGVDALASGLGQLNTGAGQLATGATQLASGTGELATGADALQTGADGVASGTSQLATGAQQLADAAAQLQQGTSQLAAAAEPIAAAGEQLGSAGDAAAQAGSAYSEVARPQLQAAGTAATSFGTFCQELPDAARQQECAATAATAVQATGDAQSVLDEVFGGIGQLQQLGETAQQLGSLGAGITQLDDGIGQLADGAAGLAAGAGELSGGAGQLAAGVGELAGGARELSTGADALSDGAAQLATGVSQSAQGAAQLSAASGQLRDGTGELRTGTTQLAAGAGELADGLQQLSDGQNELAAGNAPIQEGIDGLRDGASQLATGLQDGADRASGALGDPETYAAAIAHPVTAEVEQRNDPGLGGVVAAIALPLAAWLAGLVTVLARRLITPDALASTASSGRVLRRAASRLAAPVLAATTLVAIAGHVFGAPWVGLVGTLLITLLAGFATVGIHLLFVALWGRRGGAIASVTALFAQLIAVRGLLPLELRASWLQLLADVTPIPRAQAAAQLIYAGGDAGSIVAAVVTLLLIGAIASAAAWLTVSAKRGTSLGKVVNLRALGLPLRRPDAA